MRTTLGISHTFVYGVGSILFFCAALFLGPLPLTDPITWAHAWLCSTVFVIVYALLLWLRKEN